MQPYSDQFFDKMGAGARSSARHVIPLVLELTSPRSVIDVGCGTGAWLATFRDHRIGDYVGVDGAYVDQTKLEIPHGAFVSADLTKPFRLEREFDLVVSLEVAEHLPKECADPFVDSLVRLGPIILFSAAVPFQGGTHHVNEQWPDYWADKFEQRDYVTIDCVRKLVWSNPEVAWFYAQNTLMYCRRDQLPRHPRLRLAAENTARGQLSVVHPERYAQIAERARYLADVNGAIANDLAALVSPGEPFIFVDEDQLRTQIAVGSRAIPFTERDGSYDGPPADDAAALRELDRLRSSAAHLIIFAPPAFWWLEHYRGLARYLRSTFPCVMDNERLIAFDLRKTARERNGGSS